MPKKVDVSSYGITVENILRNVSPAALYEHAINFDKDAHVSSVGALMLRSGKKTSNT